MPSEQVYSLEVAVYKIELEPNVPVPKNVEKLHLGFKFAHKVNFDIDTQYFSPPTVDGRNIDMNYGKTFLFISKPFDLRELLSKEPYQITLLHGTNVIGTGVVQWKREFAEMVKFFETLGIVKSTTDEDWIELKDDHGKKTAKINLFLRMSCFGSNVQTMFQIKKGMHDKQQYVFRQRNRSKSFKVEKYLDERCQPIIAPLYGAITEPKSGQESLINMRENASLTQLWDRQVTPKLSTFQPPDGEQGINLDFGENMDVVSICFRPQENPFFDFLNVISETVKQTNTLTLSKNKAKRAESFMQSVGGTIKNSPNILVESDESILSTAEHIGNKLCGNKDCPAVKKFKEYGIGPLATGKNLGTIYNDVEPHVTYGISQTYGTMSSYGPFGLLTKPKEEKVVEKVTEPVAEPITEAPSKKPCKIMKLAKTKKSKKEKKKEPQWHSQNCPLCPGRLRGGSDEPNRRSMQSDNTAEGEDEGEIMPKSPMLECKSVMDQFDNILAEYKKALGPCGHATCPFAQTMADDACKKACNEFNTGSPEQRGGMSSPNKTSSMSCNDVPCDFDECPYSGEQQKKKRYPAGCGNPKCAYTKYKLGLVDDDAEMELQFLPPPLAGNCGSPQCQYPVAPSLPPIHWDCPDPLPRGQCQNLNCPFQPARLKKFKTKKQIKTGPCGSPMCPYAFPQPCAVPTCPFSSRPCPMNEGRNQQPGNEEDLCENPDCPFAEKNAKKEIPNEIDDPKFKGEFQDCANADCPNREKGDKKKKKKDKKKKKEKKNKERRSSSSKKEKKSDRCDSASGDASDGKSGECEDSECPFNKSKSKEEKKKSKKKKSSSSEDGSCDPGCVMNEKNEKKAKTSKNRCLESSSESICSDSECPYAGLKKKRNGTGDADNSTCSREEGSICSNVDCPERQARQPNDPDACPVPGCPYSSKPPKSAPCVDPRCPYLQPLPSCGVPNCPYEPVPVRFNCKNPQCPSHRIDFSKKAERNKAFGDCEKTDDNKNQKPNVGSNNVPAPLQTTSVCDENAVCDKEDDCENPDCDMKEGDKLKSRTGQEKKALAVHQRKKGKRKRKGKFVYSIGDTYPITKLGHKECVMPVFNVPPHMGWLWNIFTPILQLKPRRGWRPGALTKTIAARIRAHRESKGLGQLRIPNFKGDGTKFDEGPVDPKVNPKPTLQIQKKEGAYWITMNPLKDPFSLVENEDPYMECTPMTFKITKNKKPDDDYCYCDGEEPPESLSSSDSELDIEFTPPAGIIHPDRFKKRPNIVCCESQYDPKDFEVEKKEKAGKKGKGKDKKGGKAGGGKKGKKK